VRPFAVEAANFICAGARLEAEVGLCERKRGMLTRQRSPRRQPIRHERRGSRRAHSISHRDTNPATWAETVRYPHYDQVGPVRRSLGEGGTVTGWSNAAGTGYDVIAADAFGNRLDSWATGRWDNQGGWLHNTKEYDPHIGLVYMYQRWYDPATGTFTSAALYNLFVEHPYSSYRGSPGNMVDSRGENPWVVGAIIGIGIVVGLHLNGPTYDCLDRARAYGEFVSAGLPGQWNGPGDAIRHCAASCHAAKHCGKRAARNAGDGLEWLGRHSAGWTPYQENMDKINNAQGRWISSSTECCFEGCSELLDSKKLQVSPVEWWDAVPPI